MPLTDRCASFSASATALLCGSVSSKAFVTVIRPSIRVTIFRNELILIHNAINHHASASAAAAAEVQLMPTESH